MNGKDGQAFQDKRRRRYASGRLWFAGINEKMYEKIMDNQDQWKRTRRERQPRSVALSAIKYGDLSNQASKDYIFDIDRFTSFEGNTGPYILYTIVRMKSILHKYEESGKKVADAKILTAASESEKSLMLELAKFNSAMRGAYEENAPHRICAYIYDLANAFNHFYHETKIMTEEEDEKKQAGYIRLLELTKEVLEICIELLGFSAPERM